MYLVGSRYGARGGKNTFEAGFQPNGGNSPAAICSHPAAGAGAPPPTVEYRPALHFLFSRQNNRLFSIPFARQFK